ncbi:MAG TPA: hypothetical protein VL043_00900 [Protaetiibacter sp.]|nr:hypothetical protein [Protaetiibacter sp.]
MSAEARGNGWRGFDGIGERVERNGFGHGPERGGWLYRCDGMPSMFGCGEELIVTRRLARVGVKSTGWLVCYGIENVDGAGGDDGKGHDLDVVLTFCPTCRIEVERQDAARITGGAS